METENGFRITTYKKKDLACLYCPNATARCAIRTLTRWIKRNHELYEALAHTGYNVRTRTFMPKQVSLIVEPVRGARSLTEKLPGRLISGSGI